MTFVLTNDDGIDAPGIQALRVALGDRAPWVVAPDRHLSGCSHQMNRGGPIAIVPRSDRAFAIGGTPADCTRVALSHLCPEATWVLSGINAGGNLGADIYLSGTVAAVREATLLRVPGIALSHYIQQRRPIDWALATRLATRVLDTLMAKTPPPGCFWNVNLPHLTPGDPEPEIVFCAPCTQPLPTEFKVDQGQFYYVGDYGNRRHDPDSDVAICFSGYIAVTQLRLW
ncbi:5'/3'-nucleotidase SurE [Nodosilinea sp. LEGE 07088]|uniref:5'/3'-nucleotidase SurE n=1 Tax=Nodosilinea sp. LEGE 07088 TaxID=2777968 RepID=UPI00187E7E9B|nr:5'/3'-nucleotidase SurE [Nodosilinea sp. LEGE 07088]MBE9140858.1 5'/3'-nucleotidase SurE [Nodosilinea sp. LEGE 07088]